mmetsp:Transcript_11044/g.25893  ORF Transcript_11044/g.25893 Transcript_11044/m.25893 type:complete len:418 (-) Transcript_11044:121-1374(-)|eukprot:CAMPEP_0172615900 /NCGR_PEP_ID=MMETSP1068-20121228/62580_1 /TAXON_ID=35684 /ORGANISM="Pseudopedinella elastica, Strain CCMP716" /LENGTH=417 /DNA_ID=CAMNT_0013421185 /DNA_START=187 /DNA_END=1440 /DNA_ORIENTATION=+
MSPTTYIVTLLLMLPEIYIAYHGEDHDNDDLSVASQMNLDEYQRKKKLEAIQALKGQLEEHPDLTGQTQREGTLREHTIAKSMSKNQYWTKTAPIGYDYDVAPGLVYQQARDFYEPIPAEDFNVNVLLNPCKGHAPDCCQDVFGAPQYISKTHARYTGYSSAIMMIDKTGTGMPVSESRLVDQVVHFDARCPSHVDAGSAEEMLGQVPARIEYDAYGNTVRTKCIGSNLAMNLDLQSPVCWDHNATVNATEPCRTVNGEAFMTCVAVAYYSSAYIVQCGGMYREDDHCGTFLELHAAKTGAPELLPVGSDRGKWTCGVECNQRVLSQVRLEGGFGGGYRTTTLPLTVRGNASEVVCEGAYEVWWVQRTLWGYVTQFKKNFTVVAPLCDFDIPYDRQEMYSTRAVPALHRAKEFRPGH